MINSIKERISRILPQNTFVRSVGMLIGGTVGSQLMMIMAAPLLTRLYSPDDFGLLAVYIGLLSLFVVVASLRYELAIPLPESSQDAANVVVLSLVCVIGTAMITALVVMFAGELIANALDIPLLSEYLWLFPIGVIVLGFYQVFNYWAIRNKKFSTIARTRIAQVIATLGIQLLGYKLGSIALLVGQTAGQGMGGVSLANVALRKPEFKRCSWLGIRMVASRYRQLPLFSTWGALFNTAGQQLPPLMFAVFFSSGAAGLYALANRVLMMPMSMIGGAIGNVFFANAAEAYRDGRLASLVYHAHQQLAYIVMPATLLLLLVGPELFLLIFGEQWQEAGVFARWMAPWLYMVFVTSPLSTIFSIIEKEQHGMLFQALLLIMRMVAIGIGALQQDLDVAVMLFSFVSALCWFGLLIWVIIKSDNKVQVVFVPTLMSFLSAAICILPVWLSAVIWRSPPFIWSSIGVTTLLLVLYYFKLVKKAYKA